MFFFVGFVFFFFLEINCAEQPGALHFALGRVSFSYALEGNTQKLLDKCEPSPSDWHAVV